MWGEGKKVIRGSKYDQGRLYVHAEIAQWNPLLCTSNTSNILIISKRQKQAKKTQPRLHRDFINGGVTLSPDEEG
jgi:hypothetical protein